MTSDPRSRLEKAIQAAEKRHQQIKDAQIRLRNSFDSPDLTQLRKALEPLEQLRRSVLGDTRRLNDALGISPAVQVMMSSLSHLDELQKINDVVPGMLESLAKVHSTWQLDFSMREIAAEAERTRTQLQSMGLAKMKLMEVSSVTVVAEALLRDIDFESVQRSLQINDSALAKVQEQAENLSERYDSLIQSFAYPTDILTLPDFILPMAGEELLFNSYALRSLQIEPLEEEEQEKFDTYVEKFGIREQCQALLVGEFACFADAFAGAIDVIESESHDRTRQAFVSMRELIINLIEMLAPDDDALSWITDEALINRNGKPTRRGRLRYICRFSTHGPFGNFLETDVQSLLDLIELFNELHEIDVSLSRERLDSLAIPVQAWIVFIINVSKSSD